MARIRTIKPETPHSESMGKVSRDARLCFILMWTLADDAGRLRGNSRMLASLLFPYDDDAPKLISGWLAELEREHCIGRYEIDSNSYIEICNWLGHQKIDHASKSKLPENPASSRILANPREPSCEEGIGREGKGVLASEGERVPDNSDELIEQIAIAHPSMSHLAGCRIPKKVLDAIIANFDQDTPEQLLAGTLGFAAYLGAQEPEKRKFVKYATNAYDFFVFREYRKHLDSKPAVKWVPVEDAQ